MKIVDTKDAVGQVLCHDITQIIVGQKKGAVFKKGHVIKEEDIPVLLSVGKDHVYIWENDDTMLHENDAAEILRQITQGEGTSASAPNEGKIDLFADYDGLLTIDTQKLDEINAIGEIIIAARHGGFGVKKGDKLAGMRVVPLVISKDKTEAAKTAGGLKPLISVTPFKHKKYGIITTGNEVYHGRIKDTFTPVIEQKLGEYGAELIGRVILDDDNQKITAEINNMLEKGADMVICTGGMSVDPDDRTPQAIKNTGAEVISYGAPVLPGAMLLLAYTPDGRPIIGLPGCVMYSKRTVFDLILPYIIAGVPVTAKKLRGMGEGGLCLNCADCTFPNCAFGK